MITRSLVAFFFSFALTLSANAHAGYDISGRVVDRGSGKPLAGAAVLIEWEDAKPGTKAWTTVAEARTDDQGRFALGAPAHDCFSTRVEVRSEAHARFLDRHNRSSNFEFTSGTIELDGGDPWALVDGEWIYPTFELFADAKPAQLRFSGAAAYELYRRLDGATEAGNGFKLRRSENFYCTESDDPSLAFWDRHTCVYDQLSLGRGRFEKTHSDPGHRPGGAVVSSIATLMFDNGGADAGFAVFVDDFAAAKFLYEKLRAIAWPWQGGYSYSKRGDSYSCTHTPHDESPQGPDTYLCEWHVEMAH